ncbi:hypothetical protein BH09SUM1_BH09SUM1_23810 [soil metagenome]
MTQKKFLRTATALAVMACSVVAAQQPAPPPPAAPKATDATAQKAPPPKPLGFTWWNDLPELIRRGNEQYKTGDYDVAKQHYEDAELRNPDEATSALNLGLAKSKLGEVDEAARSFDRAADLAGQNKSVRADALYNKGTAKLQQALALEKIKDQAQGMQAPNDQIKDPQKTAVDSRKQAISSAIEAVDALTESLKMDPESESAKINKLRAQSFLDSLTVPPPPPPQQQNQQSEQGKDQKNDQSQGQKSQQDQKDQQQKKDQNSDQKDQQQQQQQQGQEGQDEKKDSDQQKQGDEKKDGDPKDKDQDGKPDEPQDQKQQDGKQGQQQKAQELTKEAAERILNMLGEETKIRTMKNRRSAQLANPEKDW